MKNEFIVFSELGYFTGLADGGIPQWSMDIRQAKPLNDDRKFVTLKVISKGLELIKEEI